MINISMKVGCLYISLYLDDLITKIPLVLILRYFLSVIARSDDVIQPFILGCETRSPKLIHISIVCIHKLISHDAVPDTSVTIIVKTLSMSY